MKLAYKRFPGRSRAIADIAACVTVHRYDPVETICMLDLLRTLAPPIQHETYMHKATLEQDLVQDFLRWLRLSLPR